MTTASANAHLPPPPTDSDVAWGSCCRPGDDACLPARPFPWFRFALGLFIAAQTMLFGLTVNLTPPDDRATLLMLQGAMLAATVLVMAMLGWPLLIDAFAAMRSRRITMEMLFILGVLAAFGLSCQSMIRGSGPVYFDVVAVLLIVYSVGRAIGSHSRRRALATMRSLTAALATARRIDRPDAPEDRIVPIESIAVGDLVRVLPGEWVPVDGRIVLGQAFVRETPFTGEWVAARRGQGDRVIAGTICEDGILAIQAATAGALRRVDRLAQIIEHARLQPTTLQRQADRFVARFLPVVLLIAIACFFAWWHIAGDIQQGLYAALAVLLVACPCAAGLATPLVLWTVLGRLATQGLVIGAGDVVEQLASADSVIFDKTGTLGDERLSLEELVLHTSPLAPEAVRAIVAGVERHSTHPVARVLSDIDAPANLRVTVHRLTVLPGRGIEAVVTLLGPLAPAPAMHPESQHLVRLLGDTPGTSSGSSPANPPESSPGSVPVSSPEPTARLSTEGVPPAEGRLHIRIEIDHHHAATAVIREKLRIGAEQAVADLRQLGLSVRIMTGDTAAGASKVAHLAPAESGMTPEAKIDAVVRLRRDDPDFARPLFVGDGLNDAAAMAASYAGIALATGSAIAIETAGATLHSADLTVLPRAVALSRRAVRVVRSNLRWAVAYNLLGIAAAATGYLHPILASLLMALSSGIVSWRSFRVTDSLSDAPHPAQSLPSIAPPAAPGVAASTGYRVGPRLGLAFAILHAVGLIGQGLILAILLRLSLPGTLLLVAGFAAITWLSLTYWRRLPHWADMTFAMVTLGGLGMNFGWWADLGFTPAVAGSDIPSCCARRVAALATGHLATGLLSWMNIGMLLLGVPAMYLLRHTLERFDLRRWCCSGMLVVGVPGMVIGMMAGSILAARLTTGMSPAVMVLVDYLLMMLGMVVGMLIPHSLEFLRRDVRADPPANT